MLSTIKATLKIASLDLECRRRVFWGIIFTFLFKLFEAVPDVLLGLMIDTAFHKQTSVLGRYGVSSDLRAVYVIGGAILLTWLGCSLFQFLGSLKWKQAASAIQYRLRMNLSAFILQRETIPLKAQGQGSLRSDYRTTNQEIDDVEFFVHRTLEDFFRLFFSTLIVGPVLLFIAPLFLVYALIPIVPTFFMAREIQRRIRPGYNAVKSATKAMCGEIDELLSGFGVIKDFGIEARFYSKLEKAAQHLDHESVRTSYLTAAMAPMTRTLVQFGVLAILIHAVVMVFHGEISFGGFAAASFLSRKFLLPFTFLGGLADMCGKGVRALGNVMGVISGVNHPSVGTDDTLPQPIASIGLQSVSYSFEQKSVFKNLNLSFQQGQLNVIKGPTGVGKSTLLRLILGDFTPSSGKVLYGSNDALIDAQAIRRNVVLVTQFPKLFTASIKDNITLFDAVVDEELLATAVDVSLTESFVGDLPHGLHTIVGPNGIRLSGGQMQSVALARAFYAKARVLLLDEPTASFDVEREAEFLQRLRQNLKDRIIIMTSHRDQPIEAADYLVDLEDLTQ